MKVDHATIGGLHDHVGEWLANGRAGRELAQWVLARTSAGLDWAERAESVYPAT